ncbi:MAG: cob(I)alamin adenosyltransferase, partial [Candidatus Frackibacter sp. T328-2]
EFVSYAYQYTQKVLDDQDVDIVILDEINNALRYELLEVDDILRLIESKNEKTELIMTGRGFADEILAAADLVTEMKAIKHPYQDQGITSRRGIEY